MTLPTFFVVGAQKAGTTSLYAMLAQHPEVFMSTPKEPGYFIRGFDDAERWQTLKRPTPDGGVQSLSEVDLGIYTRDDYEALFASTVAGTAQHRGDASTPYLPSPNAARRIHQTVPDARIVIALRDPVGRAYSAWNYNFSRGKERAQTFETALEEELAGTRDDWIYGWRYLNTGLYSQHLRRYLDLFGEDRILILKFEDFRTDSQAVFDRVCDFLALPRVAINAGERENVTVRHSSATLSAIRNAFHRPGLLKSIMKPLMPAAMRKGLQRDVTRLVDKFANKPEAMRPETRARLCDYFAEDCRKTQELVPFDISDWAPLALKPQGNDNG